MRLCRYKNIFGKPNLGLHKIRFGPFGFVDIIVTFALAGLFAWIFDINSLYTFIALFVIGQLVHWLFCVDTAFMNFISCRL
jgi:hypothetical protein